MPTPPQDPAKTTGIAALHETVRYLARTLSIVWRSSRAMTLALGALTALGGVLPLGLVWAGKRIVDAVVARSSALTVRWVMVELALAVSVAVNQRALGLVRQLLGLRLGIDVNVAILRKALALELRHFEDPAFYDMLGRARREAASRPVALVGDAFALLQSVITLAGYAAMLFGFSALASLALLGATIPATIAEIRWSKRTFQVRNWRSPQSRRLMYIEHVLSNNQHAKEVMLFHLGPFFLGRYEELSERFYAEDRRLAWKRAWIPEALSLLATGVFYATYGWMGLVAAAGRLTLGQLTLYVVALRQGQQAFQSILGGLGALYEHNLYMSNLFAYLDVEPPRASLNGAARLRALAATSGMGLRFDDVSFRYPGKEEWALHHIDLTIAPGESVALVGENGAGKTTLIKLLTRLYEPTEGRILLDGKDLRDWERQALLERFGVVFQDFNQYQLSLRENVGVGSVEHLGDEPRVTRAVERGGAAEIVRALGGLDARLGRQLEEGSELSGGQWQKVALSRAFMREEADILVLDEPTAALDAESEHAVFTSFRELARGRTTIVISHRFPTVRMAARIIVLERGAILEQGAHNTLVNRGGRYARMFELQAEGYR